MRKKSLAYLDHAWFCLADAESCRLLCGRLAAKHAPHVEEIDVLRNTLPKQPHPRPVTNAGVTHDVEQRERRFGGEIIAWLQGKARERNIKRLVIFAPPRMLGVLRSVPLQSLKGYVEEIGGDLMPMNADQLAAHPLIHELLVSACSP